MSKTAEEIEEDWNILTIINFNNIFRDGDGKVFFKTFYEAFYKTTRNSTPQNLMTTLNQYKKILDLKKEYDAEKARNMMTIGKETSDVMSCCRSYLDIPEEKEDILKLYTYKPEDVMEEGSQNIGDSEKDKKKPPTEIAEEKKITSNPQFKYVNTLRKFKENENATAIYEGWKFNIQKILHNTNATLQETENKVARANRHSPGSGKKPGAKEDLSPERFPKKALSFLSPPISSSSEPESSPMSSPNRFPDSSSIIGRAAIGANTFLGKKRKERREAFYYDELNNMPIEDLRKLQGDIQNIIDNVPLDNEGTEQLINKRLRVDRVRKEKRAREEEGDKPGKKKKKKGGNNTTQKIKRKKGRKSQNKRKKKGRGSRKHMKRKHRNTRKIALKIEH